MALVVGLVGAVASRATTEEPKMTSRQDEIDEEDETRACLR